MNTDLATEFSLKGGVGGRGEHWRVQWLEHCIPSRGLAPVMPLCLQAFLVTLSISEYLLYPPENGNIKICSPMSQSYCKESVRCHAKEVEVEQLYEDLQDLLELTPKKRCPFHHRGLECKSRKSRNTWSNRQVWPWSTEWSRAKANRVLPREHTGHSKHPLPPTQEKTLHKDITRWSTPKSDWLYSLQLKMKKLYTDSKNKTRSWLRSRTPYCQIHS